MYYLLRVGTKKILETEYNSRIAAETTYNHYYNSYQSQLEAGKIDRFTCLLFTKGVPQNEETESVKH